MTVGERVIKIRKDSSLTQAAFGEKLGVSRSVIKNIEYDIVPPKEPFETLLCQTFHVNKEWLETGEGEPYTAKAEEDDLMERYCEEHNITGNRKKIMITYAKLPPELQESVVEAVRLIADGLDTETAITSANLNIMTAEDPAEAEDPEPKRKFNINHLKPFA